MPREPGLVFATSEHPGGELEIPDTPSVNPDETSGGSRQVGSCERPVGACTAAVGLLTLRSDHQAEMTGTALHHSMRLDSD
jgi:hypothetical protein